MCVTGSSSASWLLLAGVFMLSACTLDDVDLGTTCDCAPRYECVAMTCVLLGAGDATTDSGGPGDGGPDGAPSDADLDAPPPISCLDTVPGALFCDGFEQSLRSRWTETVLRDGTATIVSAPVHDGVGALRGESTAAGGTGAVFAAELGDASSGSLYLRAWVQVPAGVPVDQVVVLALGDTTNGWVNVTLESGGVVSLLVGNDASATRPGGGPGWAEGAWRCLRLEVDIADTGGAVRLFAGDDATPIVEGTALDTLPPGNYDNLLAGVAFSAPSQGPTAVLVDDVAVGTAPIACE